MKKFFVDKELSLLFPYISIRVLLVSVLGIGLLERFVGLTYGMPYTFANIDEYVPVANAINFLQSKSLQPIHFNYPALYFYILSVTYAFWFAGGWVIGALKSATDFAFLFITQPGYFHLVGRVLTALLGTATIVVVYSIGTKKFGRDTGVLAALLFAVSTLHAELSHWALPDVPMTFFFAVAFYFAMCVAEDGGAREYVWFGIVAGAAIATKYNAGLIVLPLIIAQIQRTRSSSERFFSSQFICSVLLIGGTFVLLNPYWILDFNRAFEAFRFESTHMQIGHVGQSGVRFIWPIERLVEREQLCGVLAVAGIAYAFFWQDKRTSALMLVPTLLGLLYIGSWAKASLHYLLFLFPLLAVLAGKLLHDLLMIRAFVRFRSATTGFVLVLVVVPNIWNIGVNDLGMTTKDTRIEAKEWIESNIPSGAVVAYVSREGIPPLIDREAVYFDGSRKAKFQQLMKSGNSDLRKRLAQFLNSSATYSLFEARSISAEPTFASSWVSRVDTLNPYIRALFAIHWASMEEMRRADARYVLVSSYDKDPVLASATDDDRNPWNYSLLEGKRFFREIMDPRNAELVLNVVPQSRQLGPRLQLFKLRSQE